MLAGLQQACSDVAFYSFGKRLKGKATCDLIRRLGLTRKAVTTIDPRYSENEVAAPFITTNPHGATKSSNFGFPIPMENGCATCEFVWLPG